MFSVKSCISFISFVNSEETKKELGETIQISDDSRILKSTVLYCVDTEEAVRVSCQINDVNLRSGMLSDLSIKLTQDGNLGKAREVAHMIDQNYSQSLAFQELCINLAEGEKFQDAIEEAKNMRDEMCYGKTLEKISMKMFKKGLVDQSISLVRTIPAPGYRFSAIWCIRDEAIKLKNPEIEKIVSESAKDILKGNALLNIY